MVATSPVVTQASYCRPIDLEALHSGDLLRDALLPDLAAL